jgi:sulfur-carrier protein adenylyltransferase/sulfurtransferase
MRWKQFLHPGSIHGRRRRPGPFLEGKTLQEVTVLDVRQPGEYEEGHIPGPN